MIPYLKHLGFKKQNVRYFWFSINRVICSFIPTSGLEGLNLISVDKKKCPWYNGKSLIKELGKSCFVLLVIDALTPTPIPSSLQDTNDVVMVVTDAFHGEYLGDCIAARIVRGFINMNALKPLMFLPSKLPLHIKSIISCYSLSIDLMVNNAKTAVATVNTNVVLSLQDANFQLIK